MVVTAKDLKNIIFTSDLDVVEGFVIGVQAHYGDTIVSEIVTFQMEEMLHLTERGAMDAVIDKLIVRLNIEAK